MQNIQTEGLKQFALIEFKGHRKEIFLNCKNVELYKNGHAIVTADIGVDLGKIIHIFNSTEKILAQKYNRSVSKTIVRQANEADLEVVYINRHEENDIVSKTNIIVQSFGLALKIVDVEWQFDKQKLTVFFTAPQRVDFRELVKDLARQFKARIELRQINTRDEIKRCNDSIGICGLPVCCHSILLDYSKISIEQAKKQQISNNTSKLSGNCMRVKCCMAFEHDFYEQELSQYPQNGSTLETKQTTWKINKIDIIKREVLLYDVTERKAKTTSKEELDELLKTANIIPPATTEQAGQAKPKFEDDLVIEEDF